jgi:MFS family permease
MKSKPVLCAVVCLVAVTAPQLQAQERSRAQVYALEGLGALPGIAGCGCLALGFASVGLMAAWGNDNPGQNPGWTAAAFSLALVSAAALPTAAAYGTARVGRALGEDGSTGWAIGGAYAGLPVAVGAIVLGVAASEADPRRTHTSYWGVPLYVLGGLAIPVGAVVGYNLGAPSHTVGGRLQPPGVALTSAELPDHSVEYGVKIQLAGLRF